jgi:hypothetical protein
MYNSVIAAVLEPEVSRHWHHPDSIIANRDTVSDDDNHSQLLLSHVFSSLELAGV